MHIWKTKNKLDNKEYECDMNMNEINLNDINENCINESTRVSTNEVVDPFFVWYCLRLSDSAGRGLCFGNGFDGLLDGSGS